MSLDTSKRSLRYRLLVRLKTTTLEPGGPLYLHWTDMDGGAVVGDQFYEPRITRTSSIKESFPKGFRTKIPLPEVTLEIADPNGDYDASLELYHYWAFREVEVFAWEEGTELSETGDLIFKGFVEFPGGVEKNTNQGTITLRISDYRSGWKTDLPSETLDSDGLNTILGISADYVLPEENEGKAIPILYGDFTKELSSLGLGAEAFLVDTGQRDTTNVDPALLIAKPVQRLCLIGDTVTIVRQAALSDDNKYTTASVASGSKDLTNGTFQLDKSTWTGSGGTYAYQESDRFYIDACGDTYQAGSDYLLINNPAAIIRHLIVEYSSATADDIDSISYMAVHDYFASRTFHEARIHFTEPEDFWQVIETLCFEWGVELSNRGGKIYFSLWQPFLATGGDTIPDLSDEDIIEGTFTQAIAPDGLYANKISAKYNWSSDTESFLRTETKSFPGVSDGDVEEDWEFRSHIYRRSVKWRVHRLAWLFSRPAVVYEFETGFKGLTYCLGQRKSISHTDAKLNCRDIQIRGLRKNLETGRVRVTAMDAYIRHDIGRWTGPAQPAWENATDEQRKLCGYWTNATGEAKSGETNSKQSNWI